jgi:vacuolar-type H+-ATPase subunit I/STV1
MNTPKTISEIEKEFSKSDLTKGISIERCFEIQTFIRQSINEILDSIPLEEYEVYDDEPDNCRRILGEIKYELNKIRL